MTQISDSFTFWVHGGICQIITMNHLPEERLKKVISFALSTYAPMVLMAESLSPGSNYAYLVAYQGNEIDALRMLEVLGRNETGWSLTDGVLYSPRPSSLHPDVICEAIALASKSLATAS